MNGDALVIELINRTLQIVLKDDSPDWNAQLAKVRSRISALEQRINDEQRSAATGSSRDHVRGESR